jgi:hypothetical protein
VWLESGSTALRAGRPADAERFLNEGFARSRTIGGRGCSARMPCGTTSAAPRGRGSAGRGGRRRLRQALRLVGRKLGLAGAPISSSASWR